MIGCEEKMLANRCRDRESVRSRRYDACMKFDCERVWEHRKRFMFQQH